jgi:hypothetical protein
MMAAAMGAPGALLSEILPAIEPVVVAAYREGTGFGPARRSARPPPRRRARPRSEARARCMDSPRRHPRRRGSNRRRHRSATSRGRCTEGEPVPVTPANVDGLMKVWRAFDAFDRLYVMPVLAEGEEKNG